jgi:hypothetical protein
MTSRHLSAEQRYGLATLAAAGRNGVSDATLLADGFLLEMLRGLVLAGFATVVTETIGPAVKIERYRITDEGRKAIEERPRNPASASMQRERSEKCSEMVTVRLQLQQVPQPVAGVLEECNSRCGMLPASGLLPSRSPQ